MPIKIVDGKTYIYCHECYDFVDESKKCQHLLQEDNNLID